MFPLIRDQGADSAFLYAGRAGRWDSGWRTIGIYILGIPSSHQIYYLRSSLCSLCCCLIAKSCPTLCDPMNRSTPGLPVHYQLPEFTQTHVHRVVINRNIKILTRFTKQKYRSMEQNRKPRDKSTHIWTPYLRQRRQEYTMEKRPSFNKWCWENWSTTCKKKNVTRTLSNTIHKNKLKMD